MIRSWQISCQHNYWPWVQHAGEMGDAHGAFWFTFAGTGLDPHTLNFAAQAKIIAEQPPLLGT